MEREQVEQEELLAGLINGDSTAFRRAVALYSPQMLATARRIVGSADAEDLVQEAWITVYNKIDSFEGRSKLSTWLCQIVSNRALSSLRQKTQKIKQQSVLGEPTRVVESRHAGRVAECSRTAEVPE